ncbi:hypothetical protein MCL36_09045 [Acinetobacter pittii]|uniref:hypothetical protein n=1 Tax=Acinetobacter pittii TaxID=48296 RepID=UPI001EFD4D97|nr:hypothetical protein [Acinetobacter pittii]MCG9492674.1 hypothetical protein [Acinetobacter pittii]
MNVFFKIPATASNSVGTLDPADVREVSDFFPGVESGAWGHWTLSKDLIDSVNNRALTAVSGTVPTFTNDQMHLTGMNTTTRKGFNSGLRGVASTGFTICLVGKQTGITASFASVAGNQQSDVGTASLLFYPNQVSGYVTGRDFGAAPNAQVDTTKWTFAAASYSNDPNVIRRMVVESGEYSFTNEFTGTGPIADPPLANIFNSICLGTTQINSAQTFGLDFGEFIVFNRALTIAELKDVAFRSKRRMLQKGIVI